jgi:ankyrin repeat protein
MDTIEDHLITEDIKIEKIKNLVCGGANVNFMNHYQSTPLIYAILYSTPKVMSVLLDLGALMNGVIPLLRCIETNSLQKVDIVLEYCKTLINSTSDEITYGGYKYAHFYSTH